MLIRCSVNFPLHDIRVRWRWRGVGVILSRKIMARTLRLIFLCAMLGLASPLLARAGWSEYTQVAELIATARHYYEFRIPVAENPSGCREEHWFYRNYDAPGSQQMFDILLKAIESGIRVRVYVTGICNVNGYAEVSSIGVRR